MGAGAWVVRVRDLRVACGLDWGSASPGCVLWGAALADGHVHIFDEFKFQRMTVKDVCEGIRAKHKDWGLKSAPVYADPSLQANIGQIGETIGQTFARYKVPLLYPSNDRISGWQRVHEALATAPDGLPWMTIHPRCKYLLRTLPLMVQDDHDPEDLDTESDDHAADSLRYLLMGGLRPASGKRLPPPPRNSIAWWRKTYGEKPKKRFSVQTFR